MILLDTHVLVWAVADTKRLSKPAAAAILEAQRTDGLAIADISLWELAMLIARGRIQAYGTIESSLRLLTEGVIIQSLTPEIAAVASQFPLDCPRDPADRLIGATAVVEGVALITHDAQLRSSTLVRTVW